MEGVYFYWCAWVCWIYATFLMKKTNERTYWAAGVLVLIIGSIHRVEAGFFSATYSFFVLVVASLYAVQQSGIKLGNLVVSALSVAFLSASLRLLSVVDPVWVWMDERWMIAGSLACACLLLQRDASARMWTAVLGGCQGEVAYAAAVKGTFPYTAGSLAFFDMLALACACLYVWTRFEKMSLYIDGLQRHMKRNKPL
jgi:hypothetical protein